MSQFYNFIIKNHEKKFLWKPFVDTPSNPDELLVCSPDVNRPGLELHGFFTHFEKDRILIIGNAESAYLEEECDKEKRIEVLEALLSSNLLQ